MSISPQAQELSPSDANSAEVRERLAAIDARHGELAELARLRKQRLLDALSLFKLLAEADAADQWIAEKDRMLDTMLPPKDIDDVEIMKHRLVTVYQDRGNRKGATEGTERVFSHYETLPLYSEREG